MNSRISIIVPTYNTNSEVLDRCIQSILNQTYPYFELILVDDGSRTSCAEKLDSYLSVDDRIVVQHQPNGGAGAARNMGLKQATGDYICFVDADDEILPDYLRSYLEILERYSLDMVIGGLLKVYAKGRVVEEKAAATDADCLVVTDMDLMREKLLKMHEEPT